ncbi:hypothetical protein PHYPO_G00226690 [Pangasianodon hypophthalmus]|uniref:Uncharacterized protein n=1 Tax=Pangasianodon hypophthalmus TaxID=310915 RepID=A0A5N5NWA3_PANHP|nr:hypothetical protein PHYPO_G00226690 [Pangasianodon hypophthalmus]
MTLKRSHQLQMKQQKVKHVLHKKLKAMDLVFGTTFEQVPETRSTREVTGEEVVKYRSMAPLPLTESAMESGKVP